MTMVAAALSFEGGVAITPSDVNDVFGNAINSANPPKSCKAIWVGVAGNIALVTANGNSLALTGVPIGLLPIATAQVKATGTTATTMVALT